MLAVLDKDSPLIVKLVAFGADVTITDKANYNRRNAFSLALWKKYTNESHELSSEAYAALIDQSIRNKPILDKDPPLQFAINTQNIKAIIGLGRAGADPSIKNCRHYFPLDEALLFENIFSNAEAILHLIPHNIGPYTLMRALNSFQEHPHVLNLPHIPHLLSTILFSMQQKDFFKFNRIHIEKVPSFRMSICIKTQHNIGSLMNKFSLNMDFLHALCKLFRYVLGARRKPSTSQCPDSVLSSFEVRNRIIHMGEEASNDEAEAGDRMQEVDAIFSDPLPLFNQCCITVRRLLQYPKHKNLHLLPLPPLVRDQVMFPDLCREMCEQIKRDG